MHQTTFKNLKKSLTNNLWKYFSRGKLQLPAFNYNPPAYTGPSLETMKKNRSEHANPGIFLYYKNPIAIVRGRMQYLYDEKGKRYLDVLAGILSCNVGHAHPQLVEAGQRQLETLPHATTIYLNDQHTQYVHELAQRLPKELQNIYVLNSGSEANDLAVMMSRLYTGNHSFISLRYSYHGGVGATHDLTSLGTWKFSVPNVSGFQKVTPAYLYRFPIQDTNWYVNEVSEVIKTNTSGRVAGYIAETMMGAGGFIPHPKGYLQGVYEIVRKAGGLCIADEVQTGFGRTGSMWGFPKHDIVPDIVVFAKGIGGGAPLAAIATRAEIGQVIQNKVHFNTYGGNPVSCAMGRAVINILEQEGMIANAKNMGEFLIPELRKFIGKYEFVGDVRGDGLMIGIELIKDQQTKEPGTNVSMNVMERAKELGLLIGRGGLNSQVLRVAPPLCITKEDAQFILEVLDQCFKEYSEGQLTYF